MMVRIIHGDCRDVLTTIDHADTVITDPVWPNCPPGCREEIAHSLAGPQHVQFVEVIPFDVRFFERGGGDGGLVAPLW